MRDAPSDAIGHMRMCVHVCSSTLRLESIERGREKGIVLGVHRKLKRQEKASRVENDWTKKTQTDAVCE